MDEYIKTAIEEINNGATKIEYVYALYRIFSLIVNVGSAK